MEEIKPVQIITIKAKIPLFKGEEQANRVELIQFEENGFEVVAQKDLYKVGEKVVYIQPDYSLSNLPIFDSYIKPDGDLKRSKLGSNNRIRSVKFNLHRGDNNPVYSTGILLPIEEVCKELDINIYKFVDEIKYFDLVDALEITKWEAPESNSGSGLKSGNSNPFPQGLYKTDEPNINNCWKYIEFPCVLIGTEKVDGSSITIFIKDKNDYGICSRNYLKPLTEKRVIGRRELTFWERIKSIFGNYTNLNIYETIEADNDFIKYGKPYLYKLIEDYEKHGTPYILRGELNGKSCKGSGNKNNPSNKEENNIKFFGVDKWYKDEKIAERLSNTHYKLIVSELGIPICKTVFSQTINSKEELLELCNNYFKNNFIEGIVVRIRDGRFSAKCMNPEYDSKK